MAQGYASGRIKAFISSNKGDVRVELVDGFPVLYTYDKQLALKLDELMERIDELNDGIKNLQQLGQGV